ncbi:hypothetical protein CHS0354_001275, partial [Potamilus streckersoni]
MFFHSVVEPPAVCSRPRIPEPGSSYELQLESRPSYKPQPFYKPTTSYEFPTTRLPKKMKKWIRHYLCLKNQTKEKVLAVFMINTTLRN